jgi:hypothetical protein
MCQAFDINRELISLKREANAHHKAFWGEGEMAWAKKRRV